MRTKIEVREVSKGFASDKGRLDVVDGISFSVREGDRREALLGAIE